MSEFVDALQLFWQQLQQGRVPPLGLWSYGLLMILIVIQGPISTMLGGGAAAAGLLHPLGVLLVAAIGNLSADMVWYSVGRRGRAHYLGPLRRRHGPLVAHLQQEMREHAVRLLLLAKLSAGMAVPALIAAGLARVRWRTWFPVVFTGELLWSGLLLAVGYFAAESILAAERALLRIGGAVSLLVIVFFIIATLRAIMRRQSAPSAAPPQVVGETAPDSGP